MSSTNKTTSAAIEQTATFIHADPEPGGIIVLGGHLLNRWTNRRYRDAVHRVTEPSPVADKDGVGKGMIPERYSIAFFSFPEAATIVKPFASCCDDQNPAKYGEMNAGEYLLRKRVILYT
jgi:isopenicillin N synthase-like dioxygenase